LIALPSQEGHVLVIGAAGTDIIGRAETTLHESTSNPGRVRMCHGGVARNIAENLARLGTETVLISAVGNDDLGRQLLDHAAATGVVTDHTIIADDMPTGSYLAILDNQGGLRCAVDDMHVIEAITPQYLRDRYSLFKDAAAVVVDANLPQKTLSMVFSLARRAGVPVSADPTSKSLAERLEPHMGDLWLITPNEGEAEILSSEQVPHADREQAMKAARHLVSQGVEIAIITMAEFGAIYATAESSGHVPAVQTEIVDPTGVGDALTATLIFALLNDIPLDEAVRLGTLAASLTLQTPGSVMPELSLEMLYDQLR
jgi:pseudouridine kinase